MARNKQFHPDREPFRHTDKINLAHPIEAVHGPVSFFNPTRAHFRHDDLADPTKQPFDEKKDQNGSSNSDTDQTPNIRVTDDVDVPATDVSFLWRSRDNRKGRHPLVVRRPEPGQEAKYRTPPTSTGLGAICKNLWRMLTYYPVWDISWCVAYIFTWGSIVWVINGFFAWLPLVAPSTAFNTETLYGGGITAFIGAVVFFEFGSVLLMFEAVNENRSGCFGWAVEELLEGDVESKSGTITVRPEHRNCTHHHKNKHNFVGKHAETTAEEAKPPTDSKDGKSWQWFPSWQMLRDHYFHEIGFLACLAQFVGASIFSIAGITALPGINNHLSQGALDGIYWVPQVVGGCGFIISGLLFMLETQKNWYTPAFGVLGWHYAFWNEVGAIGFTLSGALGMAYGNSGAVYQACLSTYWGSWAFLIGSIMQWYEAVEKNPVIEVPSNAESKDIVQASRLSS